MLNSTIIIPSIGVDSVDPDQMQHSVASDQGPHSLPFIWHFVDTSTGSKLDLFNY